MLKEKTSVLFVDSKSNGSKLLLIPTFVLLYWKKFLMAFGVIFGILLILGGVLIYQTVDQSYQDELARANYIKRKIDVDKLKKSFKSIDETMLRLNSFMQERGLSTLKLNNAGGEENFEITDINEVTAFYENNIKELENALTQVPMGKPHNGEVTSTFGYRNNPFTGAGAESHSGMDFRGEIGEPIKTTAHGKVSFAGVKGGYGNCVIIDHGYNLQTLYGHMNRITVTEGQEVKIGEQIGELGNTGRSTGPHLHYEVHFKGERINPDLYLNFK